MDETHAMISAGAFLHYIGASRSGRMITVKKNKKTLIAAMLVVAMTVMSGCGKTIDTRNDPLSDYSVDSKLPFASRDPNLASESPSPSPSPSVSPSAPAQPWQSENPPASETTPTVAPAPTSRTYTRLESGAEGDEVLALQNRLIQLGYLTGTADGKYGTQTQNAIKLFQKALGISQTGIANVSLQEKLYASNAPAYSASTVATAAPNTGSNANTAAGYSTLVRGDSGDNVRKLQSRLKELGYLSGSADGSFGGQTESAVKAFQRALGLTQSGVASSSLQEKLFSANAPAAAVTVTAAPTQAPATAKPVSPTATPNNTGYSELTYGMKNSLAVQNMQTRLKALGYFTAQCTGNYYSQTAEAVKLFQKAVGLSATGTATVETQILLYASNAPAYSSATAAPTTAPAGTYVVLQKGSRGTEVSNLQKRLIALGWSSSTSADGIYGNNTVKAVKAFQAAVGYEQNGIASVELQTILFSAVAPYNSAATPEPTGTPIPSSSYQALKPGDTGEAVKDLQRRLKELGYFNGEIGGNYLTRTTAAVKQFETALGRTPTGEASAELQEILFSAAAPAYSDVNVGYTSLARGDSGLQVTNLQKRLIELGWLTGKADGDFGSATEKAVSAFQAAAGLTQSGVADSDTQNTLFSSNAPRYTAPAPVETPIPTQSPTQTPTQAPTITNPPAQSGYQALEPGDSGDLVAAMQRRLKELGYFNGNVVGNYKDLTTAAVKRFQAAMGWNQDGVASSALLEALYAASAPAYDPTVYGYIGLVNGNTGSAVTAMQQRLIELGWLSGSADGDYGKNTVNAVKAFQNAAGLSATGDADSNTLSILYSGSAPAYTAPAVTDPPVTEPPVSPTDAPTVTDPPVDEGYTVLSNGSTGDAVKRLQQRLIELGWLTGTADGDYGAATAQAVAAFQYQIAQPQDGVAGVELQERLFAADAHAYVEYQDLAEGDTGEAVLAVQMRLIELGYLDNTEANTDGEYGPLMSNAIALLQSNSGALPEDVDGVCDIEFQNFLFSDNALAYSLIDQVG